MPTNRMTFSTYIANVIGLGLFLAHFWFAASSRPALHLAAIALWAIAVACAIFSIYGGLITRAETENRTHQAMLLACTIIGGIILLGAVLSAIFLLVPSFS